jgi:hypothetical protein
MIFKKEVVPDATRNGDRTVTVPPRGVTVATATAVSGGSRSLPPFAVAVGGYFFPNLEIHITFLKNQRNIYIYIF